MVSWWAEQLGQLGVRVMLSRGILWRGEKESLDMEESSDSGKEWDLVQKRPERQKGI